jgi:hypothetical protein
MGKPVVYYNFWVAQAFVLALTTPTQVYRGVVIGARWNRKCVVVAASTRQRALWLYTSTGKASRQMSVKSEPVAGQAETLAPPEKVGIGKSGSLQGTCRSWQCGPIVSVRWARLPTGGWPVSVAAFS